MTRLPPSKSATAVLAAGVLLCALFASIAPTGDPDLFWHLRTGELCLAGLARLAHDPFSFTFAGAPWPYKDVLADVILYLGFSAFGYAWFVLLKVIVVALFALALRRGAAGRPPELLPELVAVAWFAASVRLVERPNLFSLPLFALLVGEMERIRRSAGDSPAGLRASDVAPAVLLCHAWVCLHRAGVMAPLLLLTLALYLFGLHLARAAGVPSIFGPTPLRRSVVVTFLAAAVALALAPLNPCGFATLRTAFTVASSPMLRAYISEWQPLTARDVLHFFTGIAGAMAISAALWTARTVRALRRPRSAGAEIDLWRAGQLVAFAILAMRTVRWMPYLGISATLQLGFHLAEVAPFLRERLGDGRLLRAIAGTCCIALVAATRDAPFAIGPEESRVPVGAADFAAAHHLVGPVANELSQGGYWIWRAWPKVQVLVDGRNDALYPPDFVAHTIRAQTDPAAFATLPLIEHATWATGTNSGNASSHSFLFRDPRWWLVYWSEHATLYVRRDAHPDLASFAFRYLDPGAIEASIARAVARAEAAPETLPILEGELERMVEASPDSVRANAATAIYFHLRGPAFWPRRDAVMRHLEARAPDHPAVRELARRFGE